MYSDYPCSDWSNLITMSEMVLTNGKAGEVAEIWLVDLSFQDGTIGEKVGDKDHILIWRKENK